MADNTADLAVILDALDHIEQRLENIESNIDQLHEKVWHAQNNAERHADDIRYDLERQLDSVRGDLSNLQHDVRYG